MTRKEAIEEINNAFEPAFANYIITALIEGVTVSDKALEQESNIKALGEEMRICQKAIKDEKVLIGFNMAVAICNKHLAESEEE